MRERLDGALTRRLTTVLAGAGFGKTTLLAGWASDVPCAWYSLDARDSALPALATGLVAALRERVPELPADLLPVGAAQAPGPDEVGRAEALAAHLSQALAERLADETVLVLDDLHEVEADSSAARFIGALCRQSPPRLHLVIASRAELPFPIERLRGRGEVLSLDPSQLSFSRDEIAELLSVSAVADVADLARTLHEMTGGWPAGVVLAVEALRGASPERVSDVLEGLRRPGGHLFGYLAEEVFEREPATVRDLLSRIAPFPRFTIDLCEAIGVTEARATITSLLRRGLFMQSVGGEGWYTLHALVREFALQSWPLEDSQARQLHGKAATWFEAHGHVEDALRSLAAAAAPAALATLLDTRGRELLSKGALDTLLTIARLLPVDVRSPALEELLGEAHVIQGRYDEALQCFQRATPAGERLPAILAWRIGRLAMDRGDFDEALRVYDRAILDGSRPQDEALVLASVASSHFLTGRQELSRVMAGRALESAIASRDPRALAAAHAILMLQAMGTDPQAAAEHYRSAIAAAEQARDVLMGIRIRVNWASQLSDEGLYDQALEELDVVLPQAELAGYSINIGTALNNRGEARFHLGQLDAAAADFQKASALAEQRGFLDSFAMAQLGMIFRERGDLALARAMCEKALPLLETNQHVLVQAHVRLILARVVAFEEPDRARGLAEEALAAARTFPLQLGQALIGVGWVALAQGDRQRAEACALEAASLTRAAGKPAELAESLEIQAMCATSPAERTRHLQGALSIWRDLGHPLGQARAELALARLDGGPLSRVEVERAERRLRSMGVRPAGAAGAAGLLGSLPREGDRPLEIRTLGGFQVVRQGKPASATDWQSKKARDVVKILISRRGRPVPRDVLMDALWPEEDSDRVARRLSVALATARGVLDPSRQFDSEHFIAGDDTALWLDLAYVPVDVERFLGEASAGLALERQGRGEEAREVLASAESSYTGDFLQEDLYEDWATALREEARNTYIGVARALARAASTDGDLQDAAHYRLRILERDPYDEEAHLGLVSCLDAAGQHGEARRAYQAYVSRMGELDVEPAPFPHPSL